MKAKTLSSVSAGNDPEKSGAVPMAQPCFLLRSRFKPKPYRQTAPA
jgi:hypothetical protein